MRVLEARFHPRKRVGGAFFVVGRVYCNARSARIEAAVNVRENGQMDQATSAMLEKLDYLVRASAPRSFDYLSKLRSDYWSFVEIENGHTQGGSR